MACEIIYVYGILDENRVFLSHAEITRIFDTSVKCFAARNILRLHGEMLQMREKEWADIFTRTFEGLKLHWKHNCSHFISN